MSRSQTLGSTTMRVLLVQYAGDYLGAFNRLQQTGTETYYGHAYVLEQLAAMRAHGEVAVLCCRSPERYDATLPSGVRTIAAAERQSQGQTVIDLIAAYDPTHLIVLGPLHRIIRWGVERGCRVMCLFADSFEVSAVRRWLRYGNLPALLNDERIDLVANHGINACLSLARIGVSPKKIIPWDWVHRRRPADLPAKSGPGEGSPTLAFVGSAIKQKGLGDAIRAVAVLRRRGVAAQLEIAGAGQLEYFQALAHSLGVASDIRFLGLIPNDEAFALMRRAAIVVVPSRHAYPEGLPLTIYEAFSARTPIVASDHRMFCGHVEHGSSGMVYQAGDAKKLADCVQQLLADPALYAAISEQSAQAWERLQIEAKWGDILFRWLRADASDACWIDAHKLGSEAYADQLRRMVHTF